MSSKRDANGRFVSSVAEPSTETNKTSYLRKLLTPEDVDPFSVGDVITWSTKWNYSTGYTYAAIKAGNGLWYTTGNGDTDGLTLEDLVKKYFKASNVKSSTGIKLATSFTEI